MTNGIEVLLRESKIITPADYTSRIEIWSKMEVGDEARFYAPGAVEYASVRGSAYCWGRPKHKKFKAHRITEEVVVIRRVS
jgi:hypothetical protein